MARQTSTNSKPKARGSKEMSLEDLKKELNEKQLLPRSKTKPTKKAPAPSLTSIMEKILAIFSFTAWMET